MHRTTWALLTAATMLALFLPASACGKRPGGPRHVVVITLGSTRADYLGCYGGAGGNTPGLDAFSKGSVLFTSCFTAAPGSLPSHVSIFTSLHMRDHGVLTDRDRLPDTPGLMPRALKEAGYRTAAFTGSCYPGTASGIGQGFDDFSGPPGPGHVCSPEETGGRVLAWLDGYWKEGAADRLFLWVDYPAPQPGEDISRVDAQVGLLLGRLKALGMYDDSLVVVTADQGGPFGGPGGAYDEAERVPLMVKLEGRVAAGRRAQLVSTLDIYPTVLAAAGVAAGEAVSGEDLTGIIDGPASPEVHGEVFCQSANENVLVIKTNSRTYIREIVRGAGDRREIIVDPEGHARLLENSPGEARMTDISGKEPGVEAEFEDKAMRFINDRERSRRPIRVTDEGEIEKLRSLGYIH